LTLAAHFNTADFGTLGEGRLISKASSTAANDHIFMLSIKKVGSVYRLRGRVRIGGVSATLVASSGDLSIATWYHAAFTYDGSTMRLFLNGVEVANQALTGAVDVAAAVPVAIGGQPAGAGSRFFDGLIDDVRILQRAMNPTEIAKIANG